MIENLPFTINLLFILTTLLTVFIFYKSATSKFYFLIILLTWLGIQTVLAFSKFYLVTDSFPPRLIFFIGPPLLVMAFIFTTKKGKQFLNELNLKTLTWIHIIRIPVEITLLLLFMNGKVPELMTFEGRNFDILSGITAPIIALIAFRNNSPNKTLLLAWNFICLALLFNIVINAILSAPFPFQKFAFDQPNIAILYFPFVWLPSCVVPIVLFSHLASIRQLLRKK